jgi:hypothetical protein
MAEPHRTLGCSTISFRAEPLSVALEIIRGLGFAEIDLGAIPAGPRANATERAGYRGCAAAGPGQRPRGPRGQRGQRRPRPTQRPGLGREGAARVRPQAEPPRRGAGRRPRRAPRCVVHRTDPVRGAGPRPAGRAAHRLLRGGGRVRRTPDRRGAAPLPAVSHPRPDPGTVAAARPCGGGFGHRRQPRGGRWRRRYGRGRRRSALCTSSCAAVPGNINPQSATAGRLLWPYPGAADPGYGGHYSVEVEPHDLTADDRPEAATELRA